MRERPPDFYTQTQRKAMSEQATAARYETIDCTPTWEGLLPMMLHMSDPRNIQKDKREETRQNMRAEFLRMARAADNWNKHVKEQEAATAAAAQITGA